MNENLTKVMEYLEEAFEQVEETMDYSKEMKEDKMFLEDLQGMADDIFDFAKLAYEKLEEAMGLLEDIREEVK